MIFASVLPILWKFKSYILAVILVLIVHTYWYNMKHTIKIQATEINAKDVAIAQLQAAIKVQNAGIAQMQMYAERRDREIAEAGHLAEKLQDEITLKAQQIVNKDTKIEGVIITLADCQGELGRIKAYMIEAETRFKEENK